MTESSPPPVDYGTAPTGGYQGTPPTQEEKNMAMLCYILGIITNFIGPLIIWLMKKESMPFVNDQGKEVLNFQITVFLAMIVCAILTIVLIGAILMPIVALVYLVLMIMGALKAKEGIAYRFPFAIRLLK